MENIIELMKKKITPYIGAVSFILALSALLMQIILLYSQGSEALYNIARVFNYAALEPLNFSFFKIEGGGFSNYNTYNRISGVNIAFILVFLLGSIFYIKSNKKSQGLLQFAYAIILFSSVISFLSTIFYQVNNFTLFKPIVIFSVIQNIVLLLFSYLVLLITESKYKSIRNIRFKEFKKNEHVLAIKYKRFLHLLLDSFLLVVLGFNVVKLLPRVILNDLPEVIGERFTIILLIILATIIYYVFFETLFRRTPAKFLTNTFVLATEKEKLEFNNIFVRSISRKIPFNTFSFLWGVGWHDSISETAVVSLDNNKIQKNHWFIIPILTLFFFFNYQFNNLRVNYIQYRIENGKLQSEATILENKIDNLQLGDFISLRETNSNWGLYHFFKVIAIKGDNCTLAEIEKTYNEENLEEIDFLYESKSESFKIHQVNKDYLRKGISKAYGFFSGFKEGGVNYIEGEKRMRIYAINNAFEPVVFFKSFNNRSDNEVEIEFRNFGMVCELVRVNVLEGAIDVDKSNYFPIKISKHNNDFEIYLSSTKNISPFSILLTFKDDMDNEYQYIFKSDGTFNHSFTKVEK